MSHPSTAPKFADTRLPLRHLTDVLEGRAEEFARLDAEWSGPGKKYIVTIVALGGIGKTSLVVHWKNKLLAQPDHAGIELFFDWSFYRQGTRREGETTGESHAATADLFLKEALEFFGDPALATSNASGWQKGERLAQLIGQHRTLLILDGLEPLQDARTGELRDHGLRALLRGLAAHNRGLCLVTTRQHLPELAIWHQTTAPEWELARLTDEAGAALLTKLGVNGTDPEKRDLSAEVKGPTVSGAIVPSRSKSSRWKRPFLFWTGGIVLCGIAGITFLTPVQDGSKLRENPSPTSPAISVGRDADGTTVVIVVDENGTEIRIKIPKGRRLDLNLMRTL